MSYHEYIHRLRSHLLLLTTQLVHFQGLLFLKRPMSVYLRLFAKLSNSYEVQDRLRKKSVEPH